jgi:hypothetical protein
MTPEIKVLTFDTGGTILDWHRGIAAALAAAGARRNIKADWAEATNEYRRRALKGMTRQVRPVFNIDDVHRQQFVTSICQQPGQHTDRATRLKAGAKAAGAQAGDRSSVFRLLVHAGTEPPRVRICIVDTPEMCGVAGLMTAVHGSRNVSHGVSNACNNSVGN